MEFHELVQMRRSSRAFINCSLSFSLINEILDCGRWAPSPLNLQPWEFIIIDDFAIKSRIREIAEEAKAEVIRKGGPAWAGKYETGFLEDAAVIVVVIVNPERGGLGSFFGQEFGAIQAASACIQNILLACAEKGLGALWFTFFRPDSLRDILNIPAKFIIAGALPIGKTAGEIRRVPRRVPKIYANRFGSSNFSA
ncbi:nitroreductase family protein [Desulfatiglans anilini]|uniref:nitroreductase family protein n=1 Tax=Desulfatiglans anilini TaxID=90728 RepID=UPI00055203C8|nr:nitroreductase family protein [Desulfatiglans anilini]